MSAKIDPAATHQQVVTLKDSTPVYIRTETQVPPPISQNKDAMFNVTQAGVYLGFVMLIITSIITCMKWLDGKLEKLGTSLRDDLKEIKQDLKDAEHRILENEKATVALDKRLALQEAATNSIKEGQARIEKSLEAKVIEDKEGRAEILDTIREMSKREIKPLV